MNLNNLSDKINNVRVSVHDYIMDCLSNKKKEKIRKRSTNL